MVDNKYIRNSIDFKGLYFSSQLLDKVLSVSGFFRGTLNELTLTLTKEFLSKENK